MTIPNKYFYKSQRDWIKDDSPLKIAVKSRQTGFSYCNDFRLVLLVSARDAKLDATFPPAIISKRRRNPYRKIPLTTFTL